MHEKEALLKTRLAATRGAFGYVKACPHDTSATLAVTMYQKFAAKILLASQLHACDTFLAAADAEFLQHVMVLRVLLHLSINVIFSIPVSLQKSPFTYLFSFRMHYWLKMLLPIT